MGMFDSVIVECPNCREEFEFQTKAGDCTLKRLRLTEGRTLHADSTDEAAILTGVGVQDEAKHFECSCGQAMRLKLKMAVSLKLKVLERKRDEF